MGLALDPRFGATRFVYLYFTTADGLRLERWRLTEDDRLEHEATLVTDIEAGAIHDSGRIAFGPDGMLYVATGDAGVDVLAQDDGSLNGKYLRLPADSTGATPSSAPRSSPRVTATRRASTGSRAASG
jgi:glucose/arabinose dehydrogenase